MKLITPLLSLITLVLPLATEPPPTLFRNAQIFDGETLIGEYDLLVEGGIIREIGRGLTPLAGAKVVDASGKTLIPGLIDAHTHSLGAALAEAPIFGVTTHLDMFTDPSIVQSHRAEKESGRRTTEADLFSAGILITAPGGHGTQFGLPIPTLSTPEAADRFIEERVAEGSDWIKLVYDDGRAYGIDLPTLDRSTLEAAIDAAQRYGKLAVVHIGDAEGARTAIESGANGLVHLFTDTEPEPGFVDLVVKNGAFIIPTLTVLMSITGEPGAASLIADQWLTPYLHPTSRGNLEQIFPGQSPGPTSLARYEIAKRTVRALWEAGVPVLAGSDAPNPGTAYGASLHHELELLVDAGLTPTEALAAATSRPAEIFGLSDRGRIGPGLRADLVLIDGDPTHDIRESRRIAGVWKDGVEIDREAFASAVEAAIMRADRSPDDLEDGLVSDFEGGQIEALIGNWTPSPDDFVGGNSTGDLEVVAGGAVGSRFALQIRGVIGDAIPDGWFGALWTPGMPPMTPVDLSGVSGFSFLTRGDGKAYRVILFTPSNGFQPLIQTLESGDEWERVTFSWSDFQLDGTNIAGIAIVGGPELGPFQLLIDDFRLK